MIETPEQFERAEEALTQMKRFLLAARRTHTPEAYAALSAPILRELQDGLLPPKAGDVAAPVRRVTRSPCVASPFLPRLAIPNPGL